MRNKEALIHINKIESLYPVGKLTYGGQKIWASLRFRIFFLLIYGRKEKTFENRFTRDKYIKGYLKNILWEYREHKDLLSRNKSIGDVVNKGVKPDFLIVSFGSHRTDVVNEKCFNRYTDSIVTFLEKRGESVVIELNCRCSPDEAYFPFVSIDDQLKVAKIEASKKRFKKSFFLGLKKSEIKLIEEFVNFLNKECLNHQNFTLASIVEYLRELENYKVLYKSFYTKHKPKVVFITSYYDLPSQGAIWAAKELNMPIVDVQHGTQGTYHVAYSKWGELENINGHLVPDYFFVYGESEKEQLKIKFKNVLISGNPWVEIWKKEVLKPYTDNDLKILERILSKKKRNILISLQPVDPILPDFFYSAINELREEINVLFRVHPRYKHTMGEVEKELERQGVTEFNLYESTEISLFLLLENIDLHITNASSVAIDALSFGKNTIFIDVEGYYYFKDQIEDEIFSYADNVKDLVDEIRKGVNHSKEINDKLLEVSFDESIEYLLGNIK